MLSEMVVMFFVSEKSRNTSALRVILNLHEHMFHVTDDGFRSYFQHIKYEE